MSETDLLQLHRDLAVRVAAIEERSRSPEEILEALRDFRQDMQSEFTEVLTEIGKRGVASEQRLRALEQKVAPIERKLDLTNKKLDLLVDGFGKMLELLQQSPSRSN